MKKHIINTEQLVKALTRVGIVVGIITGLLTIVVHIGTIKQRMELSNNNDSKVKMEVIKEFEYLKDSSSTTIKYKETLRDYYD